MQLLGRGMAELIPMRHHDVEPVQLELRHLRQAGA